MKQIVNFLTLFSVACLLFSCARTSDVVVVQDFATKYDMLWSSAKQTGINMGYSPVFEDKEAGSIKFENRVETDVYKMRVGFGKHIDANGQPGFLVECSTSEAANPFALSTVRKDCKKMKSTLQKVAGVESAEDESFLDSLKGKMSSVLSSDDDKKRNSSKQDSTAKTPGKNNLKVKETQKILTDLGYSPGPIDGLMGSKTRGAIKEYQEDEGLVVTGKLDEKTYASLTGTVAPTPSEQEGADSKPSTQVATKTATETSQPSQDVNVSKNNSTVTKEKGIKVIETADLLKEKDLYGAAILATVPVNSRLRVIDKSEEFYKVNYNGKLGYIYYEFVEEL